MSYIIEYSFDDGQGRQHKVKRVLNEQDGKNVAQQLEDDCKDYNLFWMLKKIDVLACSEGFVV